MLYRLLTENKNRAKVAKLVASRFGSFTLIDAEGYWQGTKEKTLVIEIDSGDTLQALNVDQLARDINAMNKQQCTLVQEIACESRFV